MYIYYANVNFYRDGSLRLNLYGKCFFKSTIHNIIIMKKYYCFNLNIQQNEVGNNHTFLLKI